MTSLIFLFASIYSLFLFQVVGDEPSEWCQYEPPVAYSYIQRVYWDNGFLTYWEAKQLPNFLLAAPAVVILIFLHIL